VTDFPTTSFWPTPVRALVILAAALAAAVITHRLIFGVLERLSRRTRSGMDNAIVRRARAPFRLILPMLAVQLVLPTLALPAELTALLRHLIALGLIAALAWLAIACLAAVDDIVALRFPTDVRDNVRARSIGTQVRVLRRVASMVVIILAVSAMLMTFPAVRQVGASILASAGLAGLVVGFAARPALANLIAGVQIALTKPIRLDDVVIVEGEWGRVEEIGSTYVVVRIWDLRRLVVPLSYFIEQPFQNWTRQTADLLGTVYLYVDYAVPVDAVRAELHRVLRSTELWDGKVWVLQVTDATERAVQLRALMSAPDSGTAFDLRCLVRERLIEFLRTHYPESLPRTRAELHPLAVNGPTVN
jgi:small-conductance mechanosensitive channel